MEMTTSSGRSLAGLKLRSEHVRNSQRHQGLVDDDDKPTCGYLKFISTEVKVVEFKRFSSRFTPEKRVPDDACNESGCQVLLLLPLLEMTKLDHLRQQLLQPSSIKYYQDIILLGLPSSSYARVLFSSLSFNEHFLLGSKCLVSLSCLAASIYT